jgi:hypothetical protein
MRGRSTVRACLVAPSAFVWFTGGAIIIAVMLLDHGRNSHLASSLKVPGLAGGMAFASVGIVSFLAVAVLSRPRPSKRQPR